MNPELNDFLFSILDIIGTFVFAISGAQAAKERELDLFGLFIISFLTACGGGIVRDICLGITPPVGISQWIYLALSALASLAFILFQNYISKLNYPVLLFDALGLSLFAVAGAQKSLFLGQNYGVAIVLGVLSAIGGGIIRDILLGGVPVVFRKEVYGSAALIGSSIVVLFHYFNLNSSSGAWLAIIVCFCIRYFSIKNKWNLPRI